MNKITLHKLKILNKLFSTKTFNVIKYDKNDLNKCTKK